MNKAEREIEINGGSQWEPNPGPLTLAISVLTIEL